MTAPAIDLKAYLAEQENKSFLRFLTCGSVDDGKSTLIGRLLYDSKMLFEDHLSALEKDSKKFGTDGDNIDFALLVDGLEAEREQGITIDVAYRFFATDKRKFIVADTPGHEQYTRNMATGASNSELAVVLIDARKGVLTQSKRHSYIASLLGIRHVVLAVNKIDLVGYSQEIFNDIVRDYQEFAQQLGFPVCFVPHLLPVRRGLLATCYVQTDADVRALLEEAYATSNVVRVLPEGVTPELARVQGTDAAEIGVFTDGATGTAIVICAIDNLGKGASGQAVQNANLVLGLDETAGLRLNGVLV